MALFAIITGNIITNIIDAPEDWPEGEDVTNLTPKPGIGWTRVGPGQFTPPTTQSDPPPEVRMTPLMTQEAFVSRLDFMTEFVPVNAARRTDDVVDAAFVRLYGARNVDVRLPLAQSLLALLVMKGLLAAERIPTLLQPIPLTSPGAIDPRTGTITPEPFE